MVSDVPNIPLIAALVAFAAQNSQAQIDDSWIWWSPPARVTQYDRLGQTSDQVIRMGLDKFADLSYKARKRMKPGSSDDWPLACKGGDGLNACFAACIRDRNELLLAKLPLASQMRLRDLRSHLWRFGMACVALENALAGGGTYADHEPMNLFGNEEKTIFGVIRDWHVAKVGAKLPALLKKRLAKYRLMTQAQVDLPAGSPVKLGKIHKFARIADAEFRAIESSAAGLSPAGKKVVTAFEADYLIGYLRIRYADGSKPDDFKWIGLPLRV